MRYAVGDLQGCLQPLLRLLAEVNFDPSRDELWLVGDLVSRGPESLATLEYVQGLEGAVRCSLGNHDLHLLALLHGIGQAKPKEGLQAILDSPNAAQLADWLARLPLVQQNEQFFMSHAGIPPCWSMAQATELANEVSQALALSSVRSLFLRQMYGNQPNPWHDNLQGMERLRCITNSLTRMRYCDGEGRLDFQQKDAVDQAPEGMQPWFAWWPVRSLPKTLLFGHWAALMGRTERHDIIGLDTGCVWGNHLTMLCLDNGDCLGCGLEGTPFALPSKALS